MTGGARQVIKTGEARRKKGKRGERGKATKGWTLIQHSQPHPSTSPTLLAGEARSGNKSPTHAHTNTHTYRHKDVQR